MMALVRDFTIPATGENKEMKAKVYEATCPSTFFEMFGQFGKPEDLCLSPEQVDACATKLMMVGYSNPTFFLVNDSVNISAVKKEGYIKDLFHPMAVGVVRDSISYEFGYSRKMYASPSHGYHVYIVVPSK